MADPEQPSNEIAAALQNASLSDADTEAATPAVQYKVRSLAQT